MQVASADYLKVCSAALEIRKLTEELKCADALRLLFDYHKADVAFWVNLKKYLMSTVSCHREFSLISLLIECSSKSDLSQSAPLIPGLAQRNLK